MVATDGSKDHQSRELSHTGAQQEPSTSCMLGEHCHGVHPSPGSQRVTLAYIKGARGQLSGVSRTHRSVAGWRLSSEGSGNNFSVDFSTEVSRGIGGGSTPGANNQGARLPVSKGLSCPHPTVFPQSRERE